MLARCRAYRRGAEAAVVEGQYVEAGLGQPGREGLEAGVLRAAEAVRHDHDRPAARTVERRAGAGEVPAVELDARGGEGDLVVLALPTHGRTVP